MGRRLLNPLDQARSCAIQPDQVWHFGCTILAARVSLRARRRVTMGIENRGFASLDQSKRREVSSKGGRAAHAKGTAHMWTSEEASQAGRKGGSASAQRRKERTAEHTDLAAAS